MSELLLLVPTTSLQVAESSGLASVGCNGVTDSVKGLPCSDLLLSNRPVQDALKVFLGGGLICFSKHGDPLGVGGQM